MVYKFNSKIKNYTGREATTGLLLSTELVGTQSKIGNYSRRD